jgi:diguanylate cyclase (GGDEF)-like protein/PAS domain S-box-containing protein
MNAFINIERTKWIEVYRWIVICLGLVCVGMGLGRLLSDGIELRFALLIGVTVLVASRISIKIIQFNGTITFSDVCVFMALLIWGEGGAIVVAVAEAISSSVRVSRKLSTYLFNIGVAGISTWLTAEVLTMLFGAPEKMAANLSAEHFVVAVCVMALSQYLILTTMVAIMQALKLDLSLWQAWTNYYLWVSVTFFAAAIPAGLVAWFASDFGIYALVTIAPIMGLVYFTYETYMRNLYALEESEQLFRSSFDHASVGMALVSPEGKWLQINESLCELVKSREEDLLGSSFGRVIHGKDLPELQSRLAKVLSGDIDSCQMETRMLTKDGEDSWVVLSASASKDVENKVRNLIFQVQNITQRKQAEDKLIHEASHDSLTGLLNRAAFNDRLTAALQKYQNTKRRLLVVLFLDLDGFKMVNDSLGHVAGDELLKVVSARLLDSVRGRDTVARLGGDEFTVLLENLTDMEQAIQVADRISQKISEPFYLAGQEIFVGTSIGVASSVISYESADEMLRDADAAMYQAKALGKGCYILFDHEMHTTAARKLRIANDLRRAIERNELVVNYQSINSVDSHDLWGFESLLRWRHPLFGLLSPGEFIPIAEENGIINQLDDWVMRTSCRQLSEWQDIVAGSENLSISVNVSSRRFAQSDLVENVKEILQETGLSPKCLQIEITESTMMRNLNRTADTLSQLSALGVRIALDDFGTGYSSLSYLQELPITTLKIDRSFVSRIGAENDSREIVRAVITLAESMKMNVVAEGVETSEQLEQLAQVGCQYCQGFLFSKPTHAGEAFTIITRHAKAAMPHIEKPRLQLVSNL